VDVDFLPFLAISTLLILMPGPDTAVVTKNALLGGRRSGVFAAVGVSMGLTVWTIAAALGVAALLQASAVGFLVLKVVGAVYLIWIGVQMLRARDLMTAATSAGHGVDPHAVRAKALRQGLLSDLSNPKIAVFFTSFLPQFVHGDGPAYYDARPVPHGAITRHIPRLRDHSPHEGRIAEIADLSVNNSGDTTVSLCHRVYSGSLVFVRFLHRDGEQAYEKGHPTAHEAQAAEPPDFPGRFRIRLIPCQPRTPRRGRDRSGTTRI